MKMYKFPGAILLAVLAATGFAAVPASAQTLELTPFMGYQFGGKLEDRFQDDFDEVDVENSENYGLALAFNQSDMDQVELLYSVQDTTVDSGSRFLGHDLGLKIEYLHIGGRHHFAPDEMVNPFVSGSIGATMFEFDNGGDDEKFSMALGGGVTLGADRRVALRIEAKAYWTYISNDQSEYVCYDFHCFGFRDTTALWQINVTAGVVIRLGQ